MNMTSPECEDYECYSPTEESLLTATTTVAAAPGSPTYVQDRSHEEEQLHQQMYGMRIPASELQLPDIYSECTVVIHPPGRSIDVDIRRVCDFLQHTSSREEHTLDYLRYRFPMILPYQWDTLLRCEQFCLTDGYLFLQQRYRGTRRSIHGSIDLLQLFPTTATVLTYTDIRKQTHFPPHVLDRRLQQLVSRRKLRLYTRNRQRSYRRLR